MCKKNSPNTIWNLWGTTGTVLETYSGQLNTGCASSHAPPSLAARGFTRRRWKTWKNRGAGAAPSPLPFLAGGEGHRHLQQEKNSQTAVRFNFFSFRYRSDSLWSDFLQIGSPFFRSTLPRVSLYFGRRCWGRCCGRCCCRRLDGEERSGGVLVLVAAGFLFVSLFCSLFPAVGFSGGEMKIGWLWGGVWWTGRWLLVFGQQSQSRGTVLGKKSRGRGGWWPLFGLEKKPKIQNPKAGVSLDFLFHLRGRPFVFFLEEQGPGCFGRGSAIR